MTMDRDTSLEVLAVVRECVLELSIAMGCALGDRKKPVCCLEGTLNDSSVSSSSAPSKRSGKSSLFESVN